MGSVRDERIGAELRKLRGRMTSREVYDRTGITPSKLSRIESGFVRAKHADVDTLTTLYGADTTTVDRLISQVTASREPQWWTTLVGGGWASGLSYHLQLETEAERIESWTIDIVPGLLQTDDYARALIEGRPDVEPTQTAERLRLRAARRDRVEHGNVDLWAVIAEGSLHQEVGGPGVLADQLRYLAHLSNEFSIHLQVMPFRSGAHPGLGSGFHLFHFPDWPSTLYQETISRGLYIDEADMVQAHQMLMNRVQASALSPRDSRELLLRRADELMR